MVKDSKYITRVLFHLKDKRQKREVEWELSDHLAEKEARLTNIGYGAEEAFNQAETEMGDGDVLGEQLSALHRKKETKYSILLVLAFGSLFLDFYLHHILLADIDIEYVLFPNYLIIGSILLLSLLNLLLSVKYTYIFSSVSAVICMISSLRFWLSRGDFPGITFLLPWKKENFVDLFYTYGLQWQEYAADLDASKWVFWFLLAVTVCIGCCVAVLYVRKCKCKNTRADWHISKAMFAVCLILFLSAAALFSATVVQVVQQRPKLIEDVQNEMKADDDAFLKQLDTMQADSEEAYFAWVKDAFPDLDFICNADEESRNWIASDSGTVGIHASYTDAQNYAVTISSRMSDLFSYTLETFTAAQQEAQHRFAMTDGNLEAAPKPCSIYFSCTNGEQLLSLYYSNAPSEEKLHYLHYKWINGQWMLVQSDAAMYQEEVTLTPVQAQAFEKAFYDYAYANSREMIENFAEWVDFDFRCNTKVYGARRRGDVYEIYHQSVIGGYCVVNGELFDLMMQSPSAASTIPVCQVLFDGDRAVILDVIQPENSHDIEDRYSSAAYRAYQTDYAAFCSAVHQAVVQDYKMELSNNVLSIDTDSGAYTVTAVSPQVNTVKGKLEKQTER